MIEPTPPASPLTVADPRSIDELFDADPLSLTQSDLSSMIEHFRANRAAWSKEDKEAKAAGRPRKPSRYKEAPEKGSLELGDLSFNFPKESK